MASSSLDPEESAAERGKDEVLLNGASEVVVAKSAFKKDVESSSAGDLLHRAPPVARLVAHNFCPNKTGRLLQSQLKGGAVLLRIRKVVALLQLWAWVTGLHVRVDIGAEPCCKALNRVNGAPESSRHTSNE